MNIETLDDMRHALAVCSFPPRTATKRFAQTICSVPLAELSDRQRRHIIRLCWRYRRQIPWALVPSKDAVEAMDGKWQAVNFAGIVIFTTGNKRVPDAKRKPEQATLFDEGAP